MKRCLGRQFALQTNTTDYKIRPYVSAECTRSTVRISNRIAIITPTGLSSPTLRQFIMPICFLPAAIAKAGILFNVSKCVSCMCVSTNQKVILETRLVARTTIQVVASVLRSVSVFVCSAESAKSR